MNCYAVNEADNGLVHRDYSQVYDPRRALTRRFFHSGFGGGGERSRSPKGASILAITLMWDRGAPQQERCTAAFIACKTFQCFHKAASLPLYPLHPILQNGATHSNVCLYTVYAGRQLSGYRDRGQSTQMRCADVEKVGNDEKKVSCIFKFFEIIVTTDYNDFFCFFFYQIQIQKLMNCTQKLWIIIILSFLSIKYYKHISELSIGFAIIFH